MNSTVPASTSLPMFWNYTGRQEEHDQKHSLLNRETKVTVTVPGILLKDFFTFYWYLLSDLDLAFQWIRIQGFDDQRLKDWRKKYSRKFLYIYFFDQKSIFIYVQATGEVFSPQKRTSSTSKKRTLLTFSMFVGHFCPPGSGYNPYPDPQHCLSSSSKQIEALQYR